MCDMAILVTSVTQVSNEKHIAALKDTNSEKIKFVNMIRHLAINKTSLSQFPANYSNICKLFSENYCNLLFFIV